MIVVLGVLFVDRIDGDCGAKLFGVVCCVLLLGCHDVAEMSARDDEVVRGFAMGRYGKGQFARSDF